MRLLQKISALVCAVTDLTSCCFSLDAQEVLRGMTNYVSKFFGCRPCAEHFENMASESLAKVNTPLAAVLWLWSRHNFVNNRLAGKSQLGDSERLWNNISSANIMLAAVLRLKRTQPNTNMA